MSLWKRILQGMTAFSLDTVASNVAAVLGAALVFRYLDLPTYGRLTLALSLYAAATIFLNFGLGGVFTAEIARSRGSGNLARVRFLLSRYLYLNALTGVLLFATFVWVGIQRGDPLWPVMGTYLLTTALNGVANVLFHSYTRYRRLAAQSITRSLARLALLATLPMWWRADALLGVAWTYPLMDCAALLVSVRLARIALRDLRGVEITGYSFASLIDLFQQQGIYATLSIPVKKVADQLPVWFLKALIGDVAVGIYGAAQKGFSLFFAFFRSLETTIFPLVSEKVEVDKERLKIALRQMQKYTFWLGLVVAVVGGLTAHWLILIVAGEEYLAAVPVFRLMLWLLAISAFSQSQRPLFYALGQQRWLFVLYLLNALVYALILPCAIAITTIIGAVWATIFYVLLSTGTRMTVLWKLDTQFLVNPLSVVKIEGFDRRLWRILRERVLRWFGNSDAGFI
jgi:O-antigen/teichoic acid export membrane protein